MSHKTKHAITRQQQRGIPNRELEVVMEFGDMEYRPGGAISYTITPAKKNTIIGDLKYMISLVERSAKIRVIQGESGKVLTTYHK